MIERLKVFSSKLVKATIDKSTISTAKRSWATKKITQYSERGKPGIRNAFFALSYQPGANLVNLYYELNMLSNQKSKHEYDKSEKTYVNLSILVKFFERSDPVYPAIYFLSPIFVV